MKKRFRYIIEKSGTVYYFLSLNIDLISIWVSYRLS